eukprot:jgi/Orpsp1_1/1180004/evm.model.c7180000071754.1
MNTIEELNKKFKNIEEVIKNIQNDGIYKNYEINQKILYKNVLLKINKKDVILQHIIKETRIINELQRKININYERIRERNSLFKEIILKIDSCEENYKEIISTLNFIDNENNNDDINIIYEELKNKIDKVNKIIDNEIKSINIIDSLIINNKIKYLNNKVLNLKENINKSKNNINNYHNLLEQLESLINLERVYKDIKNEFDMNEEKIREKNNNDYYNKRKDFQNSIDNSIQSLIKLNNEIKNNFNLNYLNNLQCKNNIINYYQNLSNNIDDFLENFKNFYDINEKNLKNNEENGNNINENDKEKSKKFFQEILKNNYDLINERDKILVNCEMLFNQCDTNSFQINDELIKNIDELKNIYNKNSSLYENISMNNILENCDDKILFNDIKNIKNEWFSNIEYIKQIYIDLEKRNNIINDRKKFFELNNCLLQELPTSEILLNTIDTITKENFNERIENLLQSVSNAVNQWNNNANTILTDINNIFKNMINYSKLNIPYIDNEKFEKLILYDNSFEFEELNNYVCINISKLCNIKDILYSIINIQNKFDILNNELKERLNIENYDFWKSSFDSVNSFNELSIINNQLNQDYENIKKDFNENNDALLKYKERF